MRDEIRGRERGEEREKGGGEMRDEIRGRERGVKEVKREQ